MCKLPIHQQVAGNLIEQRTRAKIVPVMTEQTVELICSQHGLYGDASLIEVLHLENRGFEVIQNLEKYSSVISLNLNGNAIRKMENLDHFKNLTCLYLYDNEIIEIENLECLDKLQVLNIGRNRLENLKGIETCQYLVNLDLQMNNFENANQLESLTYCKNVHTLNLSNNSIQDLQIIEILTELPKLSVLNLQGNPITKKMKNYRKTIISKIPLLYHLDDKAVTEEEKRIAKAWSIGGHDAECKERLLIRKEKGQY